ncbi:MAG: hypothetical protein HZA00_14530 [Nitrospinae bacterium]|nr:hypothetical protein [Nitrospinota bacterium]
MHLKASDIFGRIFKTKGFFEKRLHSCKFDDIGKINNESMLFGNELIQKIHSDVDTEDYKYYNSEDVKGLRESLKYLIEKNPIPIIKEVSILNLNGVNASKSSGYRSLEDFANNLLLPDEYTWGHPITFQTEKDFNDNINFIKCRFGADCIFEVYYQEWNQKYFIINCDGFHHLAAIYRQCKEQKRDYYLKSQIIKFKINKEKAMFILNNFFH